MYRRVRSPEPTSAFQTRGYEYLIRRGCRISVARVGLLEGGRARVFSIYTHTQGGGGKRRGLWSATECRGRRQWRRDARGGRGESMGGWVHDMSCCAWLASTFFQPPQPIVSLSPRAPRHPFRIPPAATLRLVPSSRHPLPHRSALMSGKNKTASPTAKAGALPYDGERHRV